MIPYFSLVLFPAIISMFTINKVPRSSNTKRKIVDTFFLVWIFILCLRSIDVGVDLKVYSMHFNQYSQMSWGNLLSGIFSFDFEAGFSILSKIIGLFTNDFRWMIVFCAIISVLPIWYLYRSEVSSPMLMIVLFLNIAPFQLYFSGLRQAMAIAFVVPCYYFCKNNEKLKFVICVCLCMLVHNSGLILLLMYPIYHMNIRRKSFLFLFIPFVGIMYANSIPIFKFLLSFLNGKYIERYESTIGKTGAYAVLILLILLLCFVFFVIKENTSDSDILGLRNLLILSVILQVFANAHTISMRLNYYFLVFVPILVGRTINSGDDKQRPIILIALFIMLFFFSFYFIYKLYTGGDDLGIYPYMFLFNDY